MSFESHMEYLKGIKFRDLAIFLSFVPPKISKPQNREIKYPRNYVHAEFEILSFLILDQSMKLIPTYRISLLKVTKLEFL